VASWAAAGRARAMAPASRVSGMASRVRCMGRERPWFEIRRLGPVSLADPVAM
jgi:hypothetical protein